MTKQLENYLNHYNYVVGEPCGENVQAACATRLSQTMKSRSYYLSRMQEQMTSSNSL